MLDKSDDYQIAEIKLQDSSFIHENTKFDELIKDYDNNFNKSMLDVDQNKENELDKNDDTGNQDKTYNVNNIKQGGLTFNKVNENTFSSILKQNKNDDKIQIYNDRKYQSSILDYGNKKIQIKDEHKLIKSKTTIFNDQSERYPHNPDTGNIFIKLN